MQNKKRIIVGLQGAAAAGKTAVARKLSRKLPGKTARISIDVLRDMSCLNTLTSKQSDEYITMAKKVALNLTKSYLNEGCDNVIVEFAPPVTANKGFADKWLAQNLKKIGGRVFLLHTSLPTVIKRNKNRRGEFGQGNLPRKLVEKIYRDYEKYIDKKDFEVIETDKIGADKTLTIILGKII